MSEVMGEFIRYVISYIGVAVLIFFVINFLTKGFLLVYLRVKASQGSKVLVEINSATDEYYRVGKFEDGFFKFKNRAKEEKAIQMDEAVFKKFIVHTMGVCKVEVDEPGNTFIDKDFQTYNFSVDSGRLNTILMRIKNRPVPKTKQEILLLVLLLLILGAVVFMFYRVIQIEELVRGIVSLTGNI
jgi:hypothetical protein